MANKSYQVFYPCFSTNKNCLTEASYIPLEGSEKKVFKTDGFNLQNGEIWHFKFVLPEDQWKGVHFRLNKAKDIKFTMIVVDRFGNRNYQPISKGHKYKFGGFGSKEVVFTAEVTGDNPKIEFTYNEGWVTILSRPMFYIVWTLTAIAVTIGTIYLSV